jgi:nucleoside-diphosphate-sugar epimerase
VQTIVLRAGSFIDPAGNGDVMKTFLLREIGKGRLAQAGRPDTLHAYAYVPDWARAAAMLAERRDTLATFEDIPFPGHAFTAEDLRAELEAATGRRLRLAPFPWWLMRLAAPFWELARELGEMRYLWETSHALGSAKFTRLLPDFHPTDLQSVMRAGLPADVDPDQPVRAGGLPVAAE